MVQLEKSMTMAWSWKRRKEVVKCCSTLQGRDIGVAGGRTSSRLVVRNCSGVAWVAGRTKWRMLLSMSGTDGEGWRRMAVVGDDGDDCHSCRDAA